MFIESSSKKESRYLPSPPVYRCRVWWIQNRLQFQQYFSDSVSSISSVKISPANAIKISAAILQTVNLLSFLLFDPCDGDKPENINILLLSGGCLWTLHDHKTLRDKNWDEFTKPFKKKNIWGIWVLVTPAWICLRDKVSVLYVILRAQYFLLLFAACWSFVCSVREFCLQRVILLFAACSSFVCSVPEVLFAACWSFVCSVREFNSLQR